MSPDHGGNRERQCDPEAVAEHGDTVTGVLVVTSMRAVSGMRVASTRGSMSCVSVPYAVQPVLVMLVLDVLTVRFVAVVFVIVLLVAVVRVLVRVLLAPAMIH